MVVLQNNFQSLYSIPHVTIGALGVVKGRMEGFGALFAIQPHPTLHCLTHGRMWSSSMCSFGITVADGKVAR